MSTKFDILPKKELIRQKILILGGGFETLESAIWFKKYGFDVIIITKQDFMCIYPIPI